MTGASLPIFAVQTRKAFNGISSASSAPKQQPLAAASVMYEYVQNIY